MIVNNTPKVRRSHLNGCLVTDNIFLKKLIKAKVEKKLLTF